MKNTFFSILILVILLSLSCNIIYENEHSFLNKELNEYKNFLLTDRDESLNRFRKQFVLNEEKVEPLYDRVARVNDLSIDFTDFINSISDFNSIPYDVIEHKFNNILDKIEKLRPANNHNQLEVEFSLKYNSSIDVKDSINLVLLQIDILKLEIEFIKDWYANIDSHSGMYLSLFMVDNSESISKIGDVYKANVFYGRVANFSTFSFELGEVTLNGQPIKMRHESKDSNIVLVKLFPEEEGVYQWVGNLNHKTPMGRIISEPVEGRFEIYK